MYTKLYFYLIKLTLLQIILSNVEVYLKVDNFILNEQSISNHLKALKFIDNSIQFIEDYLNLVEKAADLSFNWL